MTCIVPPYCVNMCACVFIMLLFCCLCPCCVFECFGFVNMAYYLRYTINTRFAGIPSCLFRTALDQSGRCQNALVFVLVTTLIEYMGSPIYVARLRFDQHCALGIKYQIFGLYFGLHYLQRSKMINQFSRVIL